MPPADVRLDDGSSPVNQVSRTLLLEIFPDVVFAIERLRTKAMVWGSMKYWVLIASAMAVHPEDGVRS